MQALRTENDQLKRRIAEQDARITAQNATIAAINEKLSRLLAIQQQPTRQTPQPPSPPRQEVPVVVIEDETAPAAEDSGMDITDRARAEAETGGTARTTEPAPKRRALESAKDRRLTARLDSHEDRLDTLEASVQTCNERLATLSQTCQQMMTMIQNIQAAVMQLQAQLQNPATPSMESQYAPPPAQPWNGQPIHQLP